MYTVTEPARRHRDPYFDAHLWPVVVLIVLPLPTGAAAGFVVDAWLVLRDLRAGRTVNR